MRKTFFITVFGYLILETASFITKLGILSNYLLHCYYCYHYYYYYYYFQNENDILGEPVCETCIENVNDSYNFKTLCLENSKQPFDNDIKVNLESDFAKTTRCRICRSVVREGICVPLLSILEDVSMKEKINCLLPYSVSYN